MNAERTARGFGSFEDVDVLVKITEVSVPMSVGPGGELEARVTIRESFERPKTARSDSAERGRGCGSKAGRCCVG